MRRSVVLVTVALLACSAVLLFVDHARRHDGERAAAAPGLAAAAPRAPSAASPGPTTGPAQAAPAVRPAAINRYLSEDRLLELFEVLRRSNAGGELQVARRIEQDCYADTRSTFLVGKALAGLPIQRFDRGPDGALAVTQVMPTPAQRDAARELFRRCDGFGTRTRDLHGTDQAALEARLLRTDDVVGIAANIATHRVPATPDRLQAVLASRDPVAITLLDEELTARWQRRLLEPMPTGLFNSPTPVMQLIGCDLGIDCGPSSRTALVGCLDQAPACGLDVPAQLMRLASPADYQRIADARNRFLDAITRGDYTIWGL